MKLLIEKLLLKESLTRAEASSLLHDLASGDCGDVTISSVLTIFNMRPVSVAEVLGFRDALLSMANPLSLSVDHAIDVCGTGGDGKNTFNISTASAFILAACCQPVVKHGNYGVSSGCGSSNVLEALGIKFTSDSKDLSNQLSSSGICFLHAPIFHPAMKNVASVRKELGVKTFFNILGPLVNPAQPNFQLAGVYGYDLLRLYEQVFQEIGMRYGVVHSRDGYDECSLTGETIFLTWRGNHILSAEDFGLDAIDPRDLFAPDSVEGSADLLEQILLGRGSESQNHVVAANVALGLYVCEKVSSVKEGTEVALAAIKSGQGSEVLKKIQ